MKIGIGIPTSKEGMYVPVGFAGPDDIIMLARVAETLGFYSVWGADFLTPVPAMGIPDAEPPNFYELMVSLAYIAAVTDRIKLGAGAVVLPNRDPVMLAKQAATVDVFSNGRLLLGTGLGHYRDETKAIHPRADKLHRGRMLLEHLEAIHRLLAEDDVSFEGEYYAFRNVSLHPRPVQEPLPIYLSGKTPDVPDRVARWGGGWLLSRMQEKSVGERIASLRAALRSAGRELTEIDLAITRGVSIARTTEEAFERYERSRLPTRTSGSSTDRVLQQNLIGTPHEIVDQISALQRDGITHLIAQDFAVNTFDQLVEQVELFGNTVLTHFR